MARPPRLPPGSSSDWQSVQSKRVIPSFGEQNLQSAWRTTNPHFIFIIPGILPGSIFTWAERECR